MNYIGDGDPIPCVVLEWNDRTGRAWIWTARCRRREVWMSMLRSFTRPRGPRGRPATGSGRSAEYRRRKQLKDGR